MLSWKLAMTVWFQLNLQQFTKYIFHCICRAIPEENVGHKLLAKMGWKEGDSLGKTNAGILEPVSVSVQYCDCCYSWSFDWCFPMLIVPLLVCRSAFGTCVLTVTGWRVYTDSLHSSVAEPDKFDRMWKCICWCVLGVFCIIALYELPALVRLPRGEMSIDSHCQNCVVLGARCPLW